MKVITKLAELFRSDTFTNWVTGLGTSRDKTTYAQFCAPYTLTAPELSNMFRGNFLVRRIVQVPVEEMLRKGFFIEIEDKEIQERVNEALKASTLQEKIKLATVWARLYGGAAIVVGADDGQPMDQPLAEDRIRSVQFLRVVDRRFLYPQSYYDGTSPKCGEVQTYRLVRASAHGGCTGNLAFIHESRIVTFPGALTDEQQKVENNSWDDSILQAVYDALRDFMGGFRSAMGLVNDASQGVFQIKGLLEAIATPNGAQVMQTRMALVDQQRSSGRSLLLDVDAGEDFHREPTSFAGLPDMIDRAMMIVSSASGIPVTVLFGRSAAGMNATGDSDFQSYYDNLESGQSNVLKPRIERLAKLCMLAKDSVLKGNIPEEFCVEFPSLIRLSESEQIEAEKKSAERDKLYIDAEVWFPEEVALSRKRGGYNAEVEIDEKLRERMLKIEAEAATGKQTSEMYGYHLEYGVATKNEIREQIGLKPVPGGDIAPEPIVEQNPEPETPSAKTNTVTTGEAESREQSAIPGESDDPDASSSGPATGSEDPG